MKPPADTAAKKRRVRSKPGYVLDDPLLTAEESAAERGQGVSTFYRDLRPGRVPPGYRIGPRCRRWRRSHIRKGVEESRET